jgi:hypothetical protein
MKKIPQKRFVQSVKNLSAGEKNGKKVGTK